jgi:hypothetical protein
MSRAAVAVVVAAMHSEGGQVVSMERAHALTAAAVLPAWDRVAAVRVVAAAAAVRGAGKAEMKGVMR